MCNQRLSDCTVLLTFLYFVGNSCMLKVIENISRWRADLDLVKVVKYSAIPTAS